LAEPLEDRSLLVSQAARVRADLDSQYWVPAPGTLDPAAEAALPHHPKGERGTCRPDRAVDHHPDCQCTTCQPGEWALAACLDGGDAR
jgi:hypothetical protein